jgi:hypothetical protein
MPLRGKETASPSRSFSLAKQDAIRSAAPEEVRTDFSHLFEEEHEAKERRSAIAETEYNTVNYFNRLENPGNFLTQLSDFGSVNEEDLRVDGGDGGDGVSFVGDGGDGAPFGGDGGNDTSFGRGQSDAEHFDGSVSSNSVNRGDAIFARYLQGRNYSENCSDSSDDEQCSVNNFKQDASKQLQPSTLFAPKNINQNNLPASPLFHDQIRPSSISDADGSVATSDGVSEGDESDGANDGDLKPATKKIVPQA